MPPGEPTVRKADAHDVARIARLVNRAFEVEAFFVAERRDTLVGCVHAEHRDGASGYIGMLPVEPSQQRGGLGQQLMRIAEQHCRQAHCAEVLITVINLCTELRPFYERLGYRECGTAPYSDAHRATRPIHFIVMKKPLAR